MKDMVLNNKPMQSEKRFTFKWETTSKNIVTDYIARSVKSTIGEKRCIVGYDTLPLGFEDNQNKIFNVLYMMDDTTQIIEKIYFDPNGFGSITATLKDANKI